ncbi:MAG: UDP-N-acetylglucosamine--N-acetylmuramyl-(pentapeptide) pyrophosphoryl-undecaprenol N-acetylglucosamine transferase [bacterium]|nr:UDP-N-acetylglucosamine--N-acetylmuramyl-(pentapeptide) pyrophosphoryl-undecaprenol N-acetylglucosamine transferase [bacterium]
MRIMYAGGGTLGSVSPLLAVHQMLLQQGRQVDALWVGTKDGPERDVITGQGIAFVTVGAPKLRRYWHWRTLLLPCTLPFSILQARAAIKRFKPDVVVSAGSFVAVPVALAARTKRVPSLIHQQDVIPSLTNKILAPFASAITVAFSSSLAAFPANKTTVTGNPVRADRQLTERAAALELFRFSPDVPVLLVLGGGTGASALNRLVWDSLNDLVQFCQVIHITGRGKMAVIAEHPRYRAFEFLGAELSAAYAAADLVVSRAGMGVLSELGSLGKAAALIPIPSSHQVANAITFAKNNAAVLLSQTGLTTADFTGKVKEIIQDKPLLANLGRNISKMLPPQAAAAVADLVRRLSGDG